MDYETQNYPSEHDSKLAGASLLLRCQYLFLGTSEGGYGSPKNLWSPIAQRGHLERAEDNQKGLLDQSVNSGPIGDEIPDAKQGLDSGSREYFKHEAYRDFSAPDPQANVDPYDRNPDSKEEASQMLASNYRSR